MGEDKIIKTIATSTVRETVAIANDLKIQKEDILSIFPYRDQVYLIYSCCNGR